MSMALCSFQLHCQIPESVPFPNPIHQFPRRSAHLLPQTSSFSLLSSAAAATAGTEFEWESRNRMFILGMGFVGQFFAKKLKNEDWVVSGTCTSSTKLKKLEENGFDVCQFDANEPELDIVSTIKSYTHLLVSIPPIVGVGDPILQHRELLRSMLMSGNLQWLGYLSSTSVYGHSGGDWVDEDYPASPTSEAGKLRLLAEEGWLNLGCDLGLSTQVFRLGGIYGPLRSAVDTIIKHEALSKTQEFRLFRQYTSRVHVQDICQTLHASINLPSSRRTYNIVDDDPAPREEVFAYAKELIEKKWPGMVKRGTSPEGSVLPSKKKVSSRRDEKRVSNARIKSELGVELAHPSYRSGLLSIIDQMESPSQYSSSFQPIL